MIEETKEPAEFWTSLGGQSEFANADYLRDPKWIPKLFECSFGSGDFSAEQIFDFCQDDLSTDYVYILDTFYEVYVWTGPLCDDDLLTNSMEIAIVGPLLPFFLNIIATSHDLHFFFFFLLIAIYENKS